MITLICGPMYSGKSTALVQKMERFTYANKKVLFIRPKKDNRNYITHNGVNEWLGGKSKPYNLEISEWSESLLNTINAEGYDAIFIDEYFMIKNNILVCKWFFEKPHCDVYFGGLLATYDAKLFEETVDILPYCDDIIKLTGVCDDCGSQHGNYSYYTLGEMEGNITVGDSDYRCLCRKCYSKRLGGL